MSDEKEVYSMAEVAKAAGIAYVTLVTLRRAHSDRIPSQKQGQYRVFPPRAIEVVKEILRENEARRAAKVSLRVRETSASDKARGHIERAKTRLGEASLALERANEALLEIPGSVVISLKMLSHNGLFLRQSIDVWIEPVDQGFFAETVELGFSAAGKTRQEAVDNLRAVIAETYRELTETDPGTWTKELASNAMLVRMIRQSK
jgi:predicted RNase H-like HicB family nuclease